MSKGGGHSTAGFKYSMSILMGLCRGPVDEIIQINAGDLVAWQGSETINSSFSISAPDLFGGDTKEGGLDGTVDVMMGAPDQDTTGERYRAAIGGVLSDLRGVATMFYSGLICSNNPYPKKWTVRVRRALKGWYGGTAWYPDEAIIPLADANGNVIRAMNPAHIIYECLTNPVWGRGLPTAKLDEAQFINTANTLCREHFGMCLTWSRASDLAQFMQTILNHIGGAIYPDRTTGLMVLKLARKDYDPTTLPVFDYTSGLLEIKDDQTTAPDNSHSEIIVNWVDPVTNSVRQTRVQNLAGTQANQTVTSTKVDYPGLPVADLAARVGLRDLQAQGAGIKRYTLVFDRRGRKIQPLGVFRINVPERNINNMVLRAGKIEEGPIDKQTVTVVALQDVFGLETTTYLKEPERAWVRPDRTAQPITIRRVSEINYRDVVRATTPAELAVVHPTDGSPVTVASPPTPLSQAYTLETHSGSDPYVNRGQFTFTPKSALLTGISYYTTSITLDGGTGLGKVTVPTTAWIEDEIVEVTAYDATAHTMTILRGCVDTLPQTHSDGADIWFADISQGGDGREYASGDVVKLKMLTHTASAVLSETLAAEDSLTITARQGRPYAPGNFQINGVPFADVDTDTADDLVLTWTHRDRIIQADHIVSHTDGSTGPEVGVTYTVQVLDGITVLRTVTGLTTDTWTYTGAMFAADGSPGSMTLQLKSVRDGIDSYQEYNWTFNRVVMSGYGRLYGEFYGGDSGYGTRYGEVYDH